MDCIAYFFSRNRNRSQEVTLIQLQLLFAELAFDKLPGADVIINAFKIHPEQSTVVCVLETDQTYKYCVMCLRTVVIVKSSCFMFIDNCCLLLLDGATKLKF